MPAHHEVSQTQIKYDLGMTTTNEASSSLCSGENVVKLMGAAIFPELYRTVS